MVNKELFKAYELFWPVVIGAILLLVLFVWKEWKGTYNRSFFINTIVGAIGVLALSLLILKPMLAHKVDQKAYLITDGHSKQQLDSLKKIKGTCLLSYEPGKPLKDTLNTIGNLTILGDGVHPTDFWQLTAPLVNYTRPEMPKGVMRLKYDQQNTVGDTLSVNLQYHRSKTGSRLVLTDSGGNGLDSLVLKKNDSACLQLKTVLKVEGRFVYHLVEKDSLGNELIKEPLPLVASPQLPLKIFVVNRFPSFETKYVKNYLAAQGHEVIVRSQITKRKFKFEYFNTERKPLYGFSEKLLEEVDVLIVDSDTYLGFSATARRTVEDAMHNSGLGVFVQPDERLFRNTNRLGNSVTSEKIGNAHLPYLQKIKLEKYPYKISKTGSLATNNVGPYSYFEQVGNGRISTTLIKNTYQLVLKGHKSAYQRFWSQLLTSIAKKKQDPVVFEPDSRFVFQDYPHTIAFYSSHEKPVLKHGEGYQLPVRQDVHSKQSWMASTNSKNLGWQEVYVENSEVVHQFYVMENTQWHSLRAAETIKANYKNFNRQQVVGEKRVLVKRPISSYWFLLTLLSAFAYLWLQPKLKH